MAERPNPPREIAPPLPPPTPTTVALEVAEEAGATFDELGTHLSERREFAEIRLEPVRPLAMVERQPGTLVWSRRAAVVAAGASGRVAGAGSGFTVFYAVLPGVDEASPPADSDTPIVGLRWSDFAYAEPVRGPPRSMLMVRTDSPRFTGVARAFGEKLRAAFETEGE